MQNVLADLAVESEAAVWLMGRVARSFGRAASEHERAFSRIATPVAKYWICKRTPGVVGEALECHGGAGYVEDFPLAYVCALALSVSHARSLLLGGRIVRRLSMAFGRAVAMSCALMCCVLSRRTARVLRHSSPNLMYDSNIHS